MITIWYVWTSATTGCENGRNSSSNHWTAHTSSHKELDHTLTIQVKMKQCLQVKTYSFRLYTDYGDEIFTVITR